MFKGHLANAIDFEIWMKSEFPQLSFCMKHVNFFPTFYNIENRNPNGGGGD